MADNPLTKLPLAGQLGVSAVIAALICGGFYYFWYSDALETAAARRKPGSPTCRSRSGRSRPPRTGCPEFQREVQALEARLETLKRILPPGEGDARPDAARPVPRRAVEPRRSGKFNPAAGGHRRTSTRRSRSASTSRAPTTTWAPSSTA